MKTNQLLIIRILVVLMFFLNAKISLSQVIEEVEPNGCKGIKFINSNNGFMISRRGLLRSTDSGNSWDFVLKKVISCSEVKFINDSVGFVTSESTIYKTIDYGKSWNIIYRNEDYYLMDIAFATEKIGYATGPYGVFIKTKDGGSTWQQVNFGSKYSLYSITFKDSLTGLAAGDAKTLIVTKDGGETWKSITLDSAVHLYKVKFVTKQIGVVLGRYGYAMTYDGGDTWVEKLNISSDSDIHFINDHVGFMVGFIIGSPVTIYKTIDSGNTWTPTNTPPGTNAHTINAISFLNDSIGFAVGAGDILKTTDGGINWILVERKGILGSYAKVTEINPTKLLIVARDGSISSEDKGGIWSKVNLSGYFYHTYHSSHFFNNGTGFICSPLGGIQKTTDSGTTWVDVPSNTLYNLHAIHFPVADTGYIVGQYGKVLTTSDGGETWKALTSGQGSDMNGVYFVNTKIGYLVGGGGLYKTENYGKNWSKLPIVDTPLNSLCFVNDTIGFAAGDYGRIIKTKDGGNTWELQNSSTTNKFYSIHFTDSLRGFAVGIGQISYTNNGGVSWNKVPVDPNLTLYSVHTLHSGEAFATGDLSKYYPKFGAAFSMNKVLKLYCNPNEIKSITGELKACIGKSEYAIKGEGSGILYKWSLDGGGTIESITENSARINWTLPGIHRVSVIPYTSCGIGVEKSFMVEVGIGDVPEGITAINGNFIGCPGINYYSVTPTPGTIFNWEVTGGEIIENKNNQITVNWKVPGVNTISVTPKNSCGEGTTKSFSVVINSLLNSNLLVKGTFTACLGVQEFSVESQKGVTYNWYSGYGGTIVRNDTIGKIDWKVPGFHIVTLRATSYCNQTRDTTFYVIVNHSPAEPITIAGDSIICLNSTSSYSIDSISGFNYKWEVLSGGFIIDTLENIANVKWLSPGKHLIKVTSYNSCGNGTSDTLLVAVYNTELNTKIIGDSEVCSPQKFYIEKNEGDSLIQWRLNPLTDGKWYTTDTLLVDLKTPGTFKLEVKRTLKCGFVETLSSEINISKIDPQIALRQDNSRLFLVSNYENNNQWILNDQKLIDEINDSLKVTAIGAYQLEVRYKNCVGISLPIIITGQEKSHFSLGTITVFPVPTSNILNIKLPEHERLKTINVEMYDTSGKKVLNRKIDLNNTPNDLVIDVESLRTGIYYLIISNERFMESHKVHKL